MSGRTQKQITYMRNENMPTNEEIIDEKLSEVLISRLTRDDLYEMLDEARYEGYLEGRNGDDQ